VVLVSFVTSNAGGIRVSYSAGNQGVRVSGNLGCQGINVSGIQGSRESYEEESGCSTGHSVAAVRVSGNQGVRESVGQGVNVSGKQGNRETGSPTRRNQGVLLSPNVPRIFPEISPTLRRYEHALVTISQMWLENVNVAL
jgi:hypothetical protein